MRIPTVTVKDSNPRGWKIINLSAFDPAVHERVGGATPPAATPATPAAAPVATPVAPVPPAATPVPPVAPAAPVAAATGQYDGLQREELLKLAADAGISVAWDTKDETIVEKLVAVTGAKS